MKKYSENERGIFLPSFKAQIAWLTSGAALLLILCAVAYSTEDPDELIKPLSLTALYLSSAIGGICAVRLSGGRMMTGLISGLITALIVFTLSVIPIYKSGLGIAESLILNALVIPSAFVGAYVARPRANNLKKHRAKIKKMHR